MLEEIIAQKADVHSILNNILVDIHENGPIKPQHFEVLAYIKNLSPDVFKEYEPRLVFTLGLFFKTREPESILEAVYNSYAQSIKERTGISLTPVQADIHDEILDKRYFSFSAPTSTGKSFLFRELIKDFKQDIVIVVPSRALIAEYMAAVKRRLQDDKSILVMQFVENINKANTDRRIYIITPERGGDLFRIIDQLNVGLFLFDEAQISEEALRGMTFDAFVRRVDKLLPQAKKIFTHPFVKNPDAQLRKHGFHEKSSFMHYEQHSVGKIFLSVLNDKFKYFSPYAPSNKPLSSADITDDLARSLLEKDKTLLIYISKSKIYKNDHIREFKQYIDLCPKIEKREAKELVSKLKDYIGASDGEEKHSSMIDLMERGIVIHHGSIPLKARLLIEQFVNEGYSRICFATSTLIQGINMPFDAVWIDNFQFHGSKDDKILGLKNLIGRAGRTSKQGNAFDYGYVIVKNSNKKTFVERMQESVVLSNETLLDQDISQIPEDQKDLAEAIQQDTFDTELNLTESQIERVKGEDVFAEIVVVLDNLMRGTRLITEKEYRALKKSQRDKIKNSFQTIYLSHLRKQTLSKREKSILSAAISIMLWRVQGKSFKEIISLRYSYLARKDEQRAIEASKKAGDISGAQALEMKMALKIRYSQQADRLPSSEVGTNKLFSTNESVLNLNYDKLVYDTYDYLDKVIAQCIVDPIAGALELYYRQTRDSRARVMGNYIRYGTNDSTDIWLLRYGFEPEDIEWISKLVTSVDENQIFFNGKIKGLTDKQFNVIGRYLP